MAQPAGGSTPGPGGWVAAGGQGGGGAMRKRGRGGRGAVWADWPAASGGPESPAPWGPRARRGHARRAGQAVGGACARASARPMRAPLRAAGPAPRAQHDLGAGQAAKVEAASCGCRARGGGRRWT